jgi:hypothetical protein
LEKELKFEKLKSNFAPDCMQLKGEKKKKKRKEEKKSLHCSI